MKKAGAQKRYCYATIAAIAALCAEAPASGRPVNLQAQDLTASLNQLGVMQDIEILFDRSLTDGHFAAALRGGFTPEAALERLLAHSDLTYRHPGPNTFVVMRKPFAGTPSSLSGRTEAIRPNISEILVVGSRTQNVDLRRDENDIQPYHIVTSDMIENAQPLTIEEFLSTRLPINSPSPLTYVSGAPVTGHSTIDLRGLGPDQTVVLVDGRRMPSMPALGRFPQADVNALAPSAIDRVETLGTTVGGIFGLGTAGGAVNLIVKRDYSGLDISITNGISARGDAGRRGIEAHYGFTSKDERTHFMVTTSWAQDDGLFESDRPLARNYRDTFDALYPGLTPYVSPSINIVSAFGGNLSFLPQFGGKTLPSVRTFLPIDAPAFVSGGQSVLIANAGVNDLRFAPSARYGYLIVPLDTASLTATLRQDFGERATAYLDVLHLREEQRSYVSTIDTSFNVLAPGQGGNPFDDYIYASYPVSGPIGHEIAITLIDRVTAGLLYRLGRSWSGNLDFSFGQSSVRTTESYSSIDPASVDLFAGGDAIAAQLSGITIGKRSEIYARNRMYDANGRIAGPLFQMPAGPVSLTVTGEFRREHNPGERDRSFPGDGTVSESRLLSQSEAIGSLYAEARLPLFSTSSAVLPLRGLEAQFALRADRYRIAAPPTSPDPEQTTNTAKGTVAAFTFGLRARPTSGLLIRGSFASGVTPPSPDELGGFTSVGDPYGLSDPKRGEDPQEDFGAVRITDGGSSHLGAQRAQTISIGAVLEPGLVPGLRMSLDFSRLSITHAVNTFEDPSVGDLQYFIDHEDQFHGRIVRAPLTAADKAAGFMVGRITSIDATYLNNAYLKDETVDVDLDYRRSTSIGALRLHGQATWEPFLRVSNVATPEANAAGNGNGPVKWRANLDLSWLKGPFSVDLNAQFYGRYDTYVPTTVYPVNDIYVRYATHVQTIPARCDLDGAIGFRSLVSRSGGRVTELDYRFVVKNILDRQAQAFVSNFLPSEIDPFDYAVGRRFQLSVSAHF